MLIIYYCHNIGRYRKLIFIVLADFIELDETIKEKCKEGSKKENNVVG
ncbi:MAG: hypothetical protein ACTS77_01830 [Arsenophonus sp. NC-TX2-MAG3]